MSVIVSSFGIDMNVKVVVANNVHHGSGGLAGCIPSLD